MLAPATSILQVNAAAQLLNKVIKPTPLQYNRYLSKKYNATIYLKREDLQVVRSYKIRGAYNKMASLPAEQLQRGVVCASAGNHAQGFALSCKLLKVKGVVFMPVVTPQQKITQTKMFGEHYIDVVLKGDTFDDCAIEAKAYTIANNLTFIHPFDDYKIIEGQATVGKEIVDELSNIDYIIAPVGGGGLIAGVGYYVNEHSPQTKLIGVEPKGAPSMTEALQQGHPVALASIDKFVDGAAVKIVGNANFELAQQYIDTMLTVDEGKVCSSILELYSREAIVAEPAGALSVAALDNLGDAIVGKTVVCIVSGGNNDIDRMQEIKERSLRYEGLKHYFLISFAQRPGALKQFVSDVLGPTDDITRFEYMQKHNKEKGPALIGIELKQASDYQKLEENLKKYQINYTSLNDDDTLYGYLV